MSLAFKNCLRAGIPRRSFVLARFNSSAAPKTPSSPIQQLYDLREIDRLTTSVGSEYSLVIGDVKGLLKTVYQNLPLQV